MLTLPLCEQGAEGVHARRACQPDRKRGARTAGSGSSSRCCEEAGAGRPPAGVATGARRLTSVPMETGAAMDKVDKVESTIGKGIVAGFVATFVLSVLLD